ncbi:MAG: hypothetical protein FWG91_13150 [Lachnospiraceae bacterium]|nr:hypothetical protein [Lachnospiraceae bacterium]
MEENVGAKTKEQESPAAGPEQEAAFDKNQLIVGGFIFASIEDADFARAELKKIEYLEKKMNYHLPENILSTYNKVMESKMLKTPLGFNYLSRMQSKMQRAGIEKERINPIPIYTNFTPRVSGEVTEGIARQRIERRLKKEKSESDKLRSRYKHAISLCLLLCVLILAMFYITLNSDNPNIINYEQNLIDKYANWEQDLKERESIIREKERELER